MSSADRIVEALREAIDGLELDPQPERSTWSRRFTGRIGATPVIAKIPLWREAPTLEAALAAGPQADTQTEYEMLATIHEAVEAAADRTLTAARPVAYVRSVNAIVMERLDAVPLRTHLGHASGPADADEVMVRVGRWIRMFGEATGARRGSFDAGRARDELEQVAGRDRRAVDRLGVVADRLHGVPAWEGVLHADFSSVNVLVTTDGRVAVIDPNQARGPVARDLGHLMADLATNRGQLLALGVRRSASRLDRWLSRLCEGHGDIDLGVARFAYGRDLVMRLAGIDAPSANPLRALLMRVVAGRRLRAISGE